MLFSVLEALRFGVRAKRVKSASKKRPTVRLWPEQLEDRLAPALFRFTDAAKTGLWSNLANWDEGGNSPATRLPAARPPGQNKGGDFVFIPRDTTCTLDIATAATHRLEVSGTLNTASGNSTGNLSCSGSVLVTSKGEINVAKETVLSADTIRVNGTLDDSGQVTATDNTDISGGIFVLRAGSLTAGNVSVNPGGRLNGFGVVRATEVKNEGRVSIQKITGSIRIFGKYTQKAGGELSVGMGEVAFVGWSNGALLVQGTATLAGTVRALNVNQGLFDPPVGTTFPVVVAGKREDMFTTHVEPPLPAAKAWNHPLDRYSNTAYTLKVLAARVGITANDPNAGEQNATTNTGQFTVTSSNIVEVSPLRVYYQLSGSATPTDDYTTSPSNAVPDVDNTYYVDIPVGSDSATITVKPVDDCIVEGDEAVTVSLVGDPFQYNYDLDDPSSATVTIVDYETSVATISGPPITDEGTTYTLTLSDGGLPVTSWTITWGDGKTETFVGNPPSVTHVYDDGLKNWMISALVTFVPAGEPPHTCDTNTLPITVHNLPPTPTITGIPSTSLEGSPITLGSTVTDPSTADVAAGFTYIWTAFNPSGMPVAGGSSASFTFTPDDNGTYTVNLVAQDKDGGSGSVVDEFTVDNVIPSGTLSNSGPVDEGGSASVNFADQFDPSNADTIAGFHYAFDFGNDGSWEVGDGDMSHANNYQASVAFASVMVPASYLDDGPGSLTVAGVIIDKDNGVSAKYTTTIIINNVAPTAFFTGSGPVCLGKSATVTFSNQFDPSNADTNAGFTYYYDLNRDGVFAGSDEISSSPSATVPASSLSSGDNIIAGKIEDKDGGFTPYFTVITVHPPVQMSVVAAVMTQDRVEGSPVEVAVILFTGYPNDDPNTLVSRIDWGDGTVDPFLFSGSSPGNTCEIILSTSLSHVYKQHGLYTISVGVGGPTGDSAFFTTAEFFVNNAIMIPSEGFFFHVTVGDTISLVQGFGDTNPFSHLSEFTGEINWGDGTVDPAEIKQIGPGSYTVSGKHAYSMPDFYYIAVQVYDDAAQADFTFPVPLPGSFALVDMAPILLAAPDPSPPPPPLLLTSSTSLLVTSLDNDLKRQGRKAAPEPAAGYPCVGCQ